MEYDSASLAILNAILEVEQASEPRDLEFNVYDYIDLEAIDKLATTSDTEWRISFSIRDHSVELDSSHSLIVDGTEFQWGPFERAIPDASSDQK